MNRFGITLLTLILFASSGCGQAENQQHYPVEQANNMEQEEFKTLTQEELKAFRQRTDVENIELLTRTEEEWRAMLSSSEYRVLRKEGTELPWRNEYNRTKTEGIYHCRGCHHPLFSSETKYESGTGWPSFWAPLSEVSVKEREDNSWFMTRTETICARCESHIGHVFDDGPQPTGLRYCMNSAALRLMPMELPSTE